MRHRGLGQPHLGFRQRERPAAVAAARPRGRESGQGAFADQLSSNSASAAAGSGGGVDLRALPGEHPQAHAAGRQVLHGVDQVGEVAAEAVELPDDEHVARPERAHAAVEPRSSRTPDAKSRRRRGRRRRPRPAARRATGPATGSRPPLRRERSRSACVVNGCLRYTGHAQCPCDPATLPPRSAWRPSPHAA